MRKWMKLNLKVLCGMLCAALCIASLCPNALGEQSAVSAAIERSIRVGLGISPETPLTWELLTSVKTLVLKNQGLTDISSLSMCPNLEELYIDGNAIEDISSLLMMKQLRVLRAEDNAITDISALASLERLEEVNLKNNRVSDISALRGSQNLKSLTLDGNPITDISALNVLTGLLKLSLRNTSPADFSTLSSLTQLESLDLSYSGISDLSALRELTSLRYLYLQSNTISDVSPLANLSRLRTLNLEGNSNLQDTSPLLSLELESYMGPDIRQSETLVGEQEEEAALAITSAAQARNGVVRILMVDNIDDPNYFATGSGFGVGVIGEETDIFVTNRHVVFDETSNRISNQVYIMLDDNAAKRVYSSFGGYYDEEADRMFKLYLDKSHMVKCEVLYPTNADPEFPDFAILKAERKIEGRVALPLLSADEVEDTTDIWTIGYPGSADKLYNMDSTWDEMKYEADVEGSQLFTGVISRRGKMKSRNCSVHP
ncbi:MAG: leucine-rich repeat domain-containing protein [Clostridia bacterium]|nr:leucine-rich repeat domain-containing protein [Clostridia bacterium]